MKELDLKQVLRETGSKEWNESIDSRLEQMRGYLAQEAWTKGITPYLSALVGNLLRKFLKEGGDAEYMRGYIAALELVLALPVSVEGQIQREQNKGKSGGPTKYTDA
jgi:hypothetical protein